MKSNLLICALFFYLFLVFCACNKSVTPVEESPFYDYFQIADIVIDTTTVPTSEWEYGFVFTPLKAGRITKLGVRLPVAGNYTAKLWNLKTKAVLATQSINLTAANGSAFEEIAGIRVQKNDSLGLSVISNNFYRIQKKNASSFQFPQDVNNIRILSFNEQKNPGAAGGFPETQNSSRVASCVNTVFVADDE